MSAQLLQKFGLTENEANLYELLVEIGESPMKAIVAKSGLKRPTAYTALYDLEKKGLVSKRDVNKIIHFFPSPPTDLFTLAEKQYKELDRAQKDLQSIIPQLTSSYTLAVEKPIVRIFEGIEGVKKAHLELLGEKKPIMAYVAVNDSIDAMLGDFWKKYYRIRKRDNIFARVISPDSKGVREYKKMDKEELRETRIIPSDRFPITIEKDIVGNKVAFFSLRNNNLIATIIDNKEIADAERAIFELTWESATA